MPKGETSRPLNRKQKNAMKTLLRLNREMEDKSLPNQLEIIRGKPYGEASVIMRDAAKDEYTRKTMKEIGRDEGASKTYPSRRRNLKRGLATLATETIKSINKYTK